MNRPTAHRMQSEIPAAWPQLWIKRANATDKADRLLFAPDDFRVCGESFAAAGSNASAALEAIRLVQVGLGDMQIQSGQAEVYCGYAGTLVDKLDASTRSTLEQQFAPAFPTADAEVNRELARLLGMLGPSTRDCWLRLPASGRPPAASKTTCTI